MKIIDINEAHKHSKEHLYEQYSIQYHNGKILAENLKSCERALAAARYEKEKYVEMWLRYHIKENVKVTGSMDEALDYYFNSRYRRVFFTPSGGYYAVVEEEDHLFIVFAWTNPDKWRYEYKDMPALIRSIVNSSQLPVRYTGVNNIMKNHSIEIEPGLYELKL